MTEPKTADEIMGLVEDYAGSISTGSHDELMEDRAALVAAITALAAERDQAVKRQDAMRNVIDEQVVALNTLRRSLELYGATDKLIASECDALKARVRELQKELDEIPGRF